MNTNQLNDLLAWRAQREAGLRGEYSWLSLAGLAWLSEGQNAVGSAAGSAVPLPARFPERAGALYLDAGLAQLEPAPGAAWRLGEQLLAGRSGPLRPDTSGEPDLLFLDDLRLMLIQRGDQLAARLWDPQHPTRLDFPGCPWFEPRPDLRLLARVERHQPPRQVTITQMTGTEYTAQMHAALAFEIEGQTYRLDAELRDDGRYTMMFKDATAGKTSYGAGRFLVSELPAGNEVVLDFNYAYSPPCAYTEFATCPLPLPQNVLPIPIEAGEQAEPH
ncbi:MAG: DUF1684 domain-containing protein [Anaerolineales bacterium]|nr:DUF1684 domain-containing protein [Anaerolineales bacterium]